MPQDAVSRDVEEELMNKSTKKTGERKWDEQGGIPYPAQHSYDSLLYDSWNFLFMSGLVHNNVTMHDFVTPPVRVLDLGCGNGLWIIEAAKRWPATRFVGMDIQNCHPDLTRPEFQQTDIASRITWIQADFLKPLPFGPEEFDYVRFSNVALAVPEDEWQSLFEECARVLIPGGTQEVIEEDLIFPCGGLHKEDESIKSSTSSPTVAINYAYGDSTTSLSYLSTASTYSSDHGLITSSPSTNTSNTSNSMDSTSSALSARSSRSAPKEERFQNPRNHASLMKAWHGMLGRRFIAPSIISVLPFYLSTYFQDIQMMPIVHILLPPNIQQLSEGYVDTHFPIGDMSGGLSELHLDLKTDGTRWSTDSSSKRSKRQSKSAMMSTHASIHLGKTVQTIRACKDAMLAVYLEEKGFGKDEDESILREDFETAWTNWENDMKERMSMRAKLFETLGWVDPTGGEKPDWTVWREQAGEVSDASSSYIGPENLCRSLRGFVGFKAK